MKQLRDLMAAAKWRKFSSSKTMDDWLDEQRITDPTLRIAAKHAFEASGKFTPALSMRAVGELGTDQQYPRGTLATDPARYQHATGPIGLEMKTLLRKAKLNLQESYSESTVDEALDKAQLDVAQRIATKHCLAEHGCLRRG